MEAATSLPIVPPMDRNAGAPGNDRISPIPLELRIRAGVGLFGTRRAADDEGTGLIRMHEGVDLLAPIGTKVFAAATGTVVNTAGNSILMLHEHGFRYLTFYQHLQNKVVRNGDAVPAGMPLAEVGDFADSKEDHLHFEIRYPFDNANPTRGTSIPVDPTAALFQWEEKSYQNDGEVREGHVLDKVIITSIAEVRRGRLLRFLRVNVEGDSRDLYIPLLEPTPFTIGMIDSIKQAFFAQRRVKILWRDSLFFKNIQGEHRFASVIAESVVYKG